jgi:hypothetical protein
MSKAVYVDASRIGCAGSSSDFNVLPFVNLVSAYAVVGSTLPTKLNEKGMFQPQVPLGQSA